MKSVPKILIVEDESIFAYDLEALLLQLGYAVSGSVASGKDALNAIKENPPNLILMDIKLKGNMNGIEAASKAHTIYNIPVIYVTANADRDTVERAKKTDAYGFICKPIQPDAVQAVIELALYKHQTEQKLIEREAWLEATLQSIGDAVIATDSKGKITFMNPVAENLTGFKNTESVEKPLQEIFVIINPKTREPVENPVTRVIKTGEIIRLGNDTILIAKDGAEYQIADSASPIIDTSGEITGVVLVFRNVTESYALQEALKENEALLSDVFDSIQDAICLLDKDLNIIRVNKIMQDWYSHALPLENKKCYFCFQGREMECDPCPSLRSLKSGLTEMDIVPGPENSSVKWLELYAFPLRNHNSNDVIGVVEFLQDVTKRIETEEKLEEQVQQINALHLLSKQVSNSPNLEYVTEASLDGLMTMLNPDIAMIFILEDDQLILQGERFNDSTFCHYDVPIHKIGECLCGLAVTEKKPQYSTNIHKDPKCTRSECKKMGLQSFAAIPLMHQNEVIGVLSLASQQERDFNQEDIFIETVSNEISTGIKNAILFKLQNQQVESLEKEIFERMQVENALRTSEERYRRLSDNSPDLIYRMSIPDGKYEYISHSVVKITGYTALDFYLNQFFIKKIIHPDWYDYFNNEWDKITHGNISSTYEYQIIHKDGNIRWINQRNMLISDKNGNPIAIEGICTDITDRKRIEDERENLIMELETKNAELERFTYTVSHDLKSPMITISGFLDVLIKDIRENKIERINSDYERIKDAVKKMDELLKDILELSRIGRIINPPQEILFNKIVDNALGLTKGIVESNNVKVSIQNKMPNVFVDPTRIQEVLTNLIENAVKFSKNRKNPTIKIGCKKLDGRNTYFVSDNGVGINPEYYDKIFQLFDKLDPKTEGTGVGLAIVKRIIEVHHGSIWIESDGDNKGTTFYFTLPEN